jgi:hypothetical protein
MGKVIGMGIGPTDMAGSCEKRFILGKLGIALGSNENSWSPTSASKKFEKYRCSIELKRFMEGPFAIIIMLGAPVPVPAPAAPADASGAEDRPGEAGILRKS